MLRHVVLNQKKNDHHVDVVTFNNFNNVFDKELCQNNVKIFNLGFYSVYNPLNIFLVWQFFKIRKYDVVHTHLFPAQYWVAFALIFQGRRLKLITTEHSTFNRRRNHFIFKCIDKFIYSRYDKVICISDGVYNELNRWLSIKDKSKVIFNGIPVRNFVDSKALGKKELGLNDDEKILLMVGRFSPEKDHVTLLNALNLLKLSGKNYQLLLIGRGPLESKIRQLVSDLKLESNVHFLGFRDDIPEIIKSIDLSILSSHWEGFGLFAIESMACGVPVLGSNIPGLSDLINDPDLLFRRGDANDLADKIDSMMNNRTLYNIKKNYCKLRAFNYDISKTADKYLEVYRALEFKNSY